MIYSFRSKPSLAAFVACTMPLFMGICFLCPGMDCLWHKYHYCPSCGQQVTFSFQNYKIINILVLFSSALRMYAVVPYEPEDAYLIGVLIMTEMVQHYVPIWCILIYIYIYFIFTYRWQSSRNQILALWRTQPTGHRPALLYQLRFNLF